MKSAREVAADILCEVEGGALSNVALNNHLSKNELTDSDRDLAKLLVSGTLEHINEIDNVIDANSKKPSDRLKPIIRNVLRVSIFQLYYLKNIPTFAVCNEAVKIIDRRKMHGLKGFVNAVLRNISKNIPEGTEDKSSEIPDFIIDILKKRVSDRTDEVIKALDAPSRISCRFLLSKASEEEIISMLHNDNVNVEKSLIVNNGYYIDGFKKISDLEAFKKGYIQIQGISSIKAVETLNPLPGSNVLDICAAPGGKSISIADLIGENGSVVSRDISQSKTFKIKENVDRCNFDNITCEVKDATVYYPEDNERFDYVLADLPCSGLGTIGHKIEIRNRISKEKIDELASLQRSILDNAIRYVKPGGFLLYSTCTITYEENEENSLYIEKLGMERTGFSDIQLMPGIDDVSDGFFISLFKKHEN